MSCTRASVLTAILLTLASVCGCCVPESRLVWTTHFDGTSFNVDGRGDPGPSPLDDGVTIHRNDGPADAIVIRTGWSQIVILCHLPPDPDRHGYSISGQTGSGSFEAWLIPDDIVDRRDVAFLFSTMTDEQRRQMPNAYQMRGTVSLQAVWVPGGENVKSFRLDLRTTEPVSRYAFRHDDFDLDHLRSRTDQPASCRGEITGFWIHPCHIVPFI